MFSPMRDFRQRPVRHGRTPRFIGKFKRDVATRREILARRRGFHRQTTEEAKAQSGAATGLRYYLFEAAANSRERFLAHHADTIYRKLTKDHENFLRVDELCYDAAAKLVPGLTPTKKAGRGR